MSNISHNSPDRDILELLNLPNRTDGEILDLIYKILKMSQQP